MVRFEGVTKGYRDTQTKVLEQVSFHIEPGQMCFLTGESGSGKTTLLRLLLHDIEPDAGRILVNGQDISKMRHKSIPAYRRKLGVIFQDYKLIPDKNVYQNVALTKIVAGAKEKDIRHYVLMALRMVDLEHKFDQMPSELSGGEQQRVCIARAIVGNPYLIMADEPTGNLDPQNAREIMLLLEKIKNAIGSTVIVATHNIQAVEEFGYPHLHLKYGRISKIE